MRVPQHWHRKQDADRGGRASQAASVMSAVAVLCLSFALQLGLFLCGAVGPKVTTLYIKVAWG